MRWIQRRNPPYDLVPADQYLEEPKERGILVVGDIPYHVSPVTGEVIRGRAGMRRHMKQHNLAHMDDFKNEWKEKEKEREKFARGEDPKHKKEVREALIESMRNHGE